MKQEELISFIYFLFVIGINGSVIFIYTISPSIFSYVFIPLACFIISFLISVEVFTQMRLQYLQGKIDAHIEMEEIIEKVKKELEQKKENEHKN